jgi:hypothetical protein
MGKLCDVSLASNIFQCAKISQDLVCIKLDPLFEGGESDIF